MIGQIHAQNTLQSVKSQEKFRVRESAVTGARHFKDMELV